MGNFLFPGTAGYQKIDEGNANRTIASHQVAVYLLSTCATVEDAIAALENVHVGLVDKGSFDSLLQLHYALHDAGGRSAVIEYVDGQMHVYDNPLGVITNSPSFDWHQTNLRNFIRLSPDNAVPVVMSGEKLVGFGQGTGMWGLPGDFTPPSRFVRAVAFTQTALPSRYGRAMRLAGVPSAEPVRSAAGGHSGQRQRQNDRRLHQLDDGGRHEAPPLLLPHLSRTGR